MFSKINVFDLDINQRSFMAKRFTDYRIFKTKGDGFFILNDFFNLTIDHKILIPVMTFELSSQNYCSFEVDGHVQSEGL